MRTRARNASGQWTPSQRNIEVVIPSGDDQEQVASHMLPAPIVFQRPPEPRLIHRPKESLSQMPLSFISWLSEVSATRTSMFLQMTIFWLELLLMVLRATVFLATLALLKTLFFWDQASNLTSVMFAWFNGNYQSGSFTDTFFPDSVSSVSYQLHISLLPAAGEYAIFDFGLPILFGNPVVWLTTVCASWVTCSILFTVIRCLKEAKAVVASHQAVCKTST